MFILNLSVNNNSGGQGQKQIQGTQQKGSDGEFKQMASKSNGSNENLVEKEADKKTRLTRTKRVDLERSRRPNTNLFDLGENEPEYAKYEYITLIDSSTGKEITLRHLCYA